MAVVKKPVLERWDTPCSDVKDVFDVQLIHQVQLGILKYSIVSDETIYDFRFERFGPYQVSDEQYLVDYWEARDLYFPSIGNTFIVTNSEWQGELNVAYMPDAQHYVIATENSCLEIITDTLPIITVTQLL